MKHAYRILDPATGLPTENPSYSGVPSARAVSEIAGPVGVVAAVATGSSSVSSAAVFEELNQMATDYEDIGQERTADTIRAVAEMYRRHAACTIPRQPSPNVADQPRAIAARVLLDGDALCLANNRDEPTPVSGGKTQ